MYTIERKGCQITEEKPLICVPIVKRTKEEILQEAHALAEKKVAMLEWRVDYFEAVMSPEAVKEVLDELEAVVSHSMLLFTFRTKKQGGELDADEAYLLQLYALATASKAVDIIDVEFFETTQAAAVIADLQKSGTLVIASHHNFSCTPSQEKMQELLEQMKKGGADIVKLAVMPKNPSDVLSLLSVTNLFREKHEDTPVVTMSMGKYGVVSRISGEIFGSCITFGAHEQTSAPGQLQMDKLDTILTYLHEAL